MTPRNIATDLAVLRGRLAAPLGRAPTLALVPAGPALLDHPLAVADPGADDPVLDDRPGAALRGRGQLGGRLDDVGEGGPIGALEHVDEALERGELLVEALPTPARAEISGAGEISKC